jgi:lipopolysaccharide export LptBFGC system permease protein LptF
MRKVRYIFIASCIFFLQNCGKEERKESFKNYNLDFNIPYSGIYNLNKNTFRPIFDTIYVNFLTAEEQKKVINKFFEYNMDNKDGRVGIFEGDIVPSSDNSLRLYRNNKQYFSATVGKSTNPIINLFMSRKKKEVVKFNNFMDSIIISKPKFKEVEDTIRKMQERKEILII